MLRITRNRTDRSGESGFTLLELLVAIIVLSILAAIAIPVFLHQRRKGWVAHVHAALTHMARAENHHVYSSTSGGFTTNLDELVATGFNYNEDYVEPLVLAADSQNFCIQMTSKKDPTIVWHFNSEVGSPVEGPGTETSCGLSPGTLVAGEFDDPDDSDGPGDTVGNGRTDTDGDGIPDDEDPTPTGDNPGGGEGIETYPGGNPGGNPGGSGSTGNPGGNPGGPGTLIDTDGDGDLDPPVTQDDPSDDGPGNSGDGGCRDDRNDPDGGNNGGRDEIGGVGGQDDDRDCNNGSGNDDDGEDDNNAGGKNK